MEKPEDIKTDQLLDDFQGAEELIEDLGINQDVAPRILSEGEQKQEYANALGVPLEDIEFLKKHPDEFAKLKAEIASRNNKPTFPTRTVTNRERRQEKVIEQISESPKKEFENRERSVRVTRGAIDPSQWLREQYTNVNGQMVCQICKKEMPFKKLDGEYYFEAVEAFSRDIFPKEHDAQFLALCPLCAAMYKELLKKNEGALKELKMELLNMEESEFYEVPISLGELKASIRFVETHFVDIKAILEETDQ